jgi:cytoskeletal protein CcmA (bactofilin family)
VPGTQGWFEHLLIAEVAMNRFVFVLLAVLAAALPATAFAQDADDLSDGFTMRISGDYHLRPDDRVETLLVIDGDALIEGTVTDGLILINGDAVVRGVVDGDITVIRGELTLESTADVDDITLIRSDLEQQQGATVRGDIERNDRVLWPGFGILIGVIFYLGLTVAVLLAGLIFAAIGGRQLSLSAASMGERPGRTILTGLIVAIALPIVAVLAFLTVIGIPAGIALLVFLLPALWFLGYIVAGTWFGTLMLSRRRAGDGEHPYGEALLGLGVLQVIGLIPGLGAVVFVLLGTWGTGALVTYALDGMRRPPAEARPAQQSPEPLPAE